MDPIAKIVQAYKKHILSILLFSVFSNLLLLIMPIYSLQLFDRVVSSHSISTLLMLSIIVVLSFIAFGVLNLVRSLIISSTNSWIDKNVVPDLLRRSIMKSSGVVKIAVGNNLRQLNNIKNFISGHAINFFFDVPWSVVFLFVIFMVHPYQGIIAMCGIIIIFSMALIYEAATAKNIGESEDKFNENVKISDEAVRNAESVVALGMVNRAIERWQKQYDEYMKANHSVSLKSNFILSLLKTIRYILQILVLGMGVYLVLKNEMTMGGVIACSVLVGRTLAPFESSTTSWKSFVEARKSFAKLKEIYASDDEEVVLVDLPEPKGELLVEDVSYTLPRQHVPIINGINFKLAAGDSLGILGRNAAGKSTLIKVLVGILEATKGEVRLDGASMHYVLQHGFGKYIGYVPQAPQLFERSIAENIARLESKKIDSKEIIRVTELLGIHDMILRMPKGYETLIGPDGAGLSAGQRQAVALARAFYGSPRYIIMDEPNTNLDRETELGLIRAIRDSKEKGVTIIIVTHTQWLLTELDKALVMDQGELKLFGGTREVMERLK